MTAIFLLAETHARTHARTLARSLAQQRLGYYSLRKTVATDAATRAQEAVLCSPEWSIFLFCLSLLIKYAVI